MRRWFWDQYGPTPLTICVGLGVLYWLFMWAWTSWS